MSTRRTRRLAHTIAGALTITALAAPAAPARPVGWTSGSAQSSDLSVPARAPTVIHLAGNGFDWGSAAIGAGATAAVVLLCAGGVRAGSRTRMHPTR
jgi:hypothetical protein